MYVIQEEKKKVSVVKIIIIVASIAAAVAAVVAAFMIWKKKFCKDKQLNDAIDAAIDAAFAEDEEADAIEVDVVEIDA